MGLWLDVKGGAMKCHLSIKLKLTLWFTCFMALMAAVCLALILAISSKVAQKEVFQTLSLTVRANLTELAYTELDNGMARYVPGGENGFYILDFWIPSGWEDSLWLRGVLQSPNTARTLGSIFLVFLFLLPLFHFLLLCHRIQMQMLHYL